MIASRAGVPLLCALLVAATFGHAGTRRGAGVVHAHPDATKRPPLRVLLKEIDNPRGTYRYQAVRYLAFYRSDKAFDARVRCLEDPDMLIRLAALRGMLLCGDGRAIPVLERVAATDRRDLVRHRAALYAETLRDPFGQTTDAGAGAATAP